MTGEFELQRIKKLRAELNELTCGLVPPNAISCSECGCKLLYADEDTGDIHCGGCNVQLHGGLILEDEE